MASLTSNYGKILFDYYNCGSSGIVEARKVSSGLELGFANGSSCVVGFPDCKVLWDYIQKTTGARGDMAYFATSYTQYPSNYVGGSGITTIGNYASGTAAYVDNSYRNGLYYQNGYYYGQDYCEQIRVVDQTPKTQLAKKDTNKRGQILKKLYWSYYQRHRVKPF